MQRRHFLRAMLAPLVALIPRAQTELPPDDLSYTDSDGRRPFDLAALHDASLNTGVSYQP